MFYYNQSFEEVIEKLGVTTSGLSDSAVHDRLEEFGLNEVRNTHTISPFEIFISQFKSFVIYILFGATLISLILGEIVDAIAIVVILLINGILGFIQEYRAEQSIEALKKLSSTKAKVLRNGKVTEVDSVNVVPGDILLLEAGDKVCSDARVFEVSHFEVDESTLTGESVTVKKHIEPLEGKKEVADQVNMVFSGTSCTSGSAKAIVVSTGMNTQIGKIAEHINSTEKTETPLQKDLNQLGKYLGYVVLLICIFIFIVGVARNPESINLLFSGDVLGFLASTRELFLIAVALAVAAVPEGLAIVVTIALAIGVKTMLKKNALVRRLPSVETLGETTVICSDKTGTLTYNQMTVKKMYSNHQHYDITGEGYSTKGDFYLGDKKIDAKELSLLLTAGALNNNASIEHEKVIGDPTEGSLIVSCEKSSLLKSKLEKEYKRLKDIPFDSNRKMMSTLHQTSSGKIMFTKGAPEKVLALCDSISINGKVQKITPSDKKKILDANIGYAKGALRVLGFAYKDIKTDKDFAEKGLIFVGLQAMIDPPRGEVKKAIEKCHTAGIRVIMITGDHALTAAAIGHEIGISGRSVAGHEIDSLDLDKEIDSISIFARVSPEHKMKIVEALQRKGNIVAMTGDGVNDAPALKHADIGIAMGITGTDVAKEASEMILTDDNFTSIVNAVEEGRGIYNNIKKFVNYMLSSNFGEVMILFIAMLIGFTYEGEKVLPLAALHILWLNIVTDSLPAMALGVDPTDKGVMNKKPRKKNAKIIDKQMIGNIVFVGVLISIAVLGLFVWALPRYGIVASQTMALTLLVLLEVARAQMVRQQYNLGLFSNGWLLLALVSTLLLQIALIYFTPIMAFFGWNVINPLKVAPFGLEVWGLMLIITAIIYAISVGFSKSLDRLISD